MSDLISPTQFNTLAKNGAKEAKRYLDQLKKEVDELDKKAGVSKEQPSFKYMKSALVNAVNAIAMLEEAGSMMAGELPKRGQRTKGDKLVEYGTKMVSESVNCITDTLDQANLAASKSDTAQ